MQSTGTPLPKAYRSPPTSTSHSRPTLTCFRFLTATLNSTSSHSTLVVLILSQPATDTCQPSPLHHHNSAYPITRLCCTFSPFQNLPSPLVRIPSDFHNPQQTQITQQQQSSDTALAPTSLVLEFLCRTRFRLIYAEIASELRQNRPRVALLGQPSQHVCATLITARSRGTRFRYQPRFQSSLRKHLALIFYIKIYSWAIGWLPRTQLSIPH